MNDDRSDAAAADGAHLDEATMARFSAERVARILASAHVAPKERADVLAANEVDEPTFEALVARTQEAAAARATRGDLGPSIAFDEAYVTRIEEERGPLERPDHARILVGLERGDADATCAALEVPSEGLVVILRTLWRRTGTDREARAALRDEIRAIRKA